MTLLHIDLVGRRDLSGEIYRQIMRAILDSRLEHGARLPASRELARTLSVSRGTVAAAYERLESEGFVISRIGSGTFVAETGRRSIGKAPKPSDGALRPRLIWSTVDVLTPFDRAARFDFRTGLPDASLFPHRTWRRLLSRALRSSEMTAGVYDHPAGHRPLREAIARHIGVARGVDTTADEIVVTNGTQQALDILARALLEPGDRIVVEDPSYGPPRSLFRSLGVRVIGAPVDQEGLVVDALPRRARAVYVTPSHQYPLGMTMTLPRRQALLAWAERNHAAIIEDDYDSEFRFGERPLEALRTLDRTGCVVFVGSFSKTMLPTLRLGFVVAPPSLRATLHKAKFVSDWHTSTLEQAALAHFIDDGGFARHIRRARRVYRERHDMIAATIVSKFAEHLELIPCVTGLHLAALARTASVESIAAVTRLAAEEGVALFPLSLFSVNGSPRAGFILGYGAISADDIPEGLRRLRQCFERRQRRT